MAARGQVEDSRERVGTQPHELLRHRVRRKVHAEGRPGRQRGQQGITSRFIGRGSRTHALVGDELEHVEHHLVGRLQPEPHRLVWIRIVRIRGRVVVVRDDVESRARWQGHRPLWVIEQLPVEVVLGHVDERPAFAVRIVGDQVHVDPTHVHVGEERDGADVLVDDVGRADLMVAGVGRDFERHRAAQGCHDLLLHLAFTEVQPDLGAVGLGRTGGMVVGVDPPPLIRIHPPAHPLGEFVWVGAHRPDREHIEETALDASVLGATAAGEDHRVMRHLAVAGTNLDRSDPALLRQVERVREIRIVVFALRRDIDFGQGHDQVRLAKLPAVDEGRRLRQVALVATGRPRVNPPGNGVDLVRQQPRVVLEEAMAGVGEPRRHFAARHLVLDPACPRPHFVVGAQRHRRQLTGTVAGDAVLIEDRSHVPGERHLGLGRRRRDQSTDGQGRGREQAEHGPTADLARKGRHGILLGLHSYEATGRWARGCRGCRSMVCSRRLEPDPLRRWCRTRTSSA